MLYTNEKKSLRGKVWQLPNKYWRACNFSGEQCTFKLWNEAKTFASKGKLDEARKMTRNQVWQQFKTDILPHIKKTYERDGIPDKPARREAWNNYVDSLAQDGLVSYDDADNWSHPRGLETEQMRTHYNPGETWKLSDGRWAAKSLGGQVRYFDKEDQARKFSKSSTKPDASTYVGTGRYTGD